MSPTLSPTEPLGRSSRNPRRAISSEVSVGLKVGLIAEDEADLYAHFSDRSSRWDACAPEAILRGAGGRFSDLLGRDLDYAAPGLANAAGLLASNAAAYPAVLEAVRAIAAASGFE